MECSLAKLMQTSDEKVKALASIATKVLYWRTRTLVSAVDGSSFYSKIDLKSGYRQTKKHRH